MIISPICHSNTSSTPCICTANDDDEHLETQTRLAQDTVSRGITAHCWVVTATQARWQRRQLTMRLLLPSDAAAPLLISHKQSHQVPSRPNMCQR